MWSTSAYTLPGAVIPLTNAHMLKISTTTWYVNLYQQTFTAKQIILTTYRQLLHLPVYTHVTCHVVANAHSTVLSVDYPLSLMVCTCNC